MAAAEIHSYTDEDRATLVRLYTEALRFTSQDGRDALRELWQTALNIGFTGGVKAGKIEEILRTSRVRERELEEERMWGFDVGWKLAIEECALQASKASTRGPSLPSLSSVSTASTQTDSPLPCLSPDRSTVSMQTDPPVAMSSPCLISGAPAASLPPSQVALDERSEADVDVWHGAPEPEPEPDSHSPSQLSPSSFVRDFSALRTGVSHPFSSLQRRHRRGPRVSRPHSSSLPRSSRAPKTIILNIYDSIPQTSRVRYRPPPFTPTPHFRSSTSTSDEGPRLDWVHDPRLRDLSRALSALGWSRPG